MSQVKIHLISPAQLYLRNIYVVTNYVTCCPSLQYLQSNMGMLVVSPKTGNYRFWSHFWCSEGQILHLQISLRSMGKEIFIIKKSHCITLYKIRYQHLTCLSFLILVNLRNRTGKPCVTGVTIIQFEKTFRQTSLSFKQIFLQKIKKHQC